jgi:hypothetical protein
LRNVNVEPDGVRICNVVGMLMGVDGVVVEVLRVDVSREVLVVVVRARRNARGRCPECGARCPKYDRGEGPRAGGHRTWDRGRPTWRQRSGG